MKRRWYNVACALVAVGLVGVRALAADRPSILFILTDDQAPAMTGFEGHKLVKTPNLDRLTAEGVQFTRAYVATPQCAPSRASILTGQYPHTHGVGTNGDALAPDAVTFSALLKEAGYACGIVGKWHLTYENAKKPGFGFEDYIATDLNADGKKWSWKGCPVSVNGEEKTADKYLTDWHGDRAIEFLERFQEKPFFLWLCFRAPHAPLDHPPGTEQLYPPASVDLPEGMDVPVNQRPPNLVNASAVQAFSKERPKLHEARSKYYAMITRIDENVGRVLARLDELKLRENTVVVFASDNGWCLGEHGLYAKGPFFYEELIRTPLVVRWPGLGSAGTRINRVVSLVDLAPTFLELAGVRPPIIMQGESLVPLLREPGGAKWADERFVEYESQNNQKYPARGVVTEQYKLIDYLQGSDADDMFYDLKRDPEETYNLIQDQAYAAMVKVLRSRLDAWRRQTKDPTKR